MNTIQIHQVFTEGSPGNNAQQELEMLSRYLRADLQTEAKVSQSIITRSEAELFGISLPRFANRVYLNSTENPDVGAGFVNCRRLGTFIQHVTQNNSAEWGERYEDDELLGAKRNEESFTQLPHIPIGTVFAGNSVIADCLLAEPARLHRYGFRYISEISDVHELIKCYGEESHLSSTPAKVTPFVKNIKLGGGLCSQAVCFMATIMLMKHATKVCGIAEITALSQPENWREISLSGFSSHKMSKYFQGVNLNMVEQSVLWTRDFYKPRYTGLSLTTIQVQRFTSALRCYLKSGIPVILPVDTAKLKQSTGVYERNGWHAKGIQGDEHSVIVTGFSNGKTDKDRKFVFNDPGALPFMVADSLEISLLGCKIGVGNNKISDNCTMMPVTPGEVKCPILSARIRSGKDIIIQYGLDEISRAVHVMLEDICPVNLDFRHDRFLLLDLSDGWQKRFTVTGLPQPSDSDEDSINKALQNLLPDILKTNNFQKRWVWLEVFQKSVWVWDAELPGWMEFPSSKELLIRSHLLGYSDIRKPESVAFGPLANHDS